MAPAIRIVVQALLSSTGLYNFAADTQQSLSNPTPKTFSTITSPQSLSAISWASNRVDVYSLDKASGKLAHKWYEGHQWGPSATKLENLGADFVIPPAAVTWGKDRMDIFSLNNRSALSHKYWDGAAWRPSDLGAEDLGGASWDPVEQALAVTSWGPGRLDVFGHSNDGQLAHKYWDGSTWQPSTGSELETLGGKFESGFSATAWGLNRLDVVRVDESGKLLHLYWDGTKWSNWEDLQAPEKLSTPTIISWGANRLDIFAVSLSKGELYHLAWDGSQWLAWGNLGGSGLVGPVAVSSWSVNRLDIVALGADKQYYYKFWDGYQWRPQPGDEGSESALYPKGGSFTTTPAVVSWGPNRLDIFGITDQSQLGHQTWYGTGWYPEWGFENLGGL